MRAAILAAFGLLMAGAMPVHAGALSALKVFPNPVRTARGDSTVTFDNVTGGGTLQIFNAGGRKVFEKSIDASATQFIWDLKNNGGNDVASGMYVYFLTAGGDKKSGRIGIIR